MLTIDGDDLVYEPGLQRGLTRGTAWRVPLYSVRLVGEWTTDEGPYLDDWFIAFYAAEPFAIFELTVYDIAPSAERHEALWSALLQRLGGDARLRFVNSTEWRDRVVWPPELADGPLWDTKPIRRGGAIGWLHDRFSTSQECTLTAPAQRRLGVHVER